MFLLDLHFHNVAGMLDNLGNKGLVPSSDLTRDPLGKIREAAIHPVLPENTDSVTEWCEIRLDHAESAVDGPENEEDGKKMVSIPESFEIRPSGFLHGSKRDGHQRGQHDVSTPSRASQQVGGNKYQDALASHWISSQLDGCQTYVVIELRSDFRIQHEDLNSYERLIKTKLTTSLYEYELAFF